LGQPRPPENLRILAICPQLTPAGAEQQLLRFCQYVDKSRFQVDVIYYEVAGDLRPAFEAAGVTVTHIDRASLGARGLLRALRAEIKARHPHVLDCRLPSAYRFGRLAAWGAGVPVIVAQERTAMAETWARRCVDRMLNPWTSAWVGNSEAVAAHVIRDLHVRPDRVHVIYNGIDVEHFRDAAPHPLLARLRQEGRRVVLNVGRLQPVKNQRLFLRTCQRLGRQFDDLEFVLCGEGSERQALETYAAQLGLADRCRFLGLQADVAPVYAAAAVLIQSSDYEGLPNVVMEAMASGVPVVATDVGGTRELIRDGESGFLTPAGDEAALADRAAAILADPALSARLAAAGREGIARRFDIRTVVRQYETLIERLVAEKSGRGTGDRETAGPA
jgi:glycosyltransferase involved in cell wall biosynthesis